jgi:hypothetical protein
MMHRGVKATQLFLQELLSRKNVQEQLQKLKNNKQQTITGISLTLTASDRIII